jgi:hypothetical protein
LENRVLVKLKEYSKADLQLAALCMVTFAVGVFAFQHRGVLGEADLYRVLVGMLDGAVTGSGLESNFHYGRDFGFGYILALYDLAPAAVLRDPDKLISLINNLGYCFSIAGLFFFWLSTCLICGTRAATIALALFAFSPVVLELATSGHQILIATSFLFAAATCLFLPLAGWRAVLAGVAGAILLIIGLCIRAEIFLALPFIVLARLHLTSWPTFLRSVLLNAVSPTAAFVIFLALKHIIVPHQPADGPGFFEQFYRWSNILPGTVYMSLGAGTATIIAAMAVVLAIAWKMRSGDSDNIKRTLEQIVGPVALILVPFVFWIANPQPSRHFILTVAGISILIGWAIASLTNFSRVLAVTTVLGLIVANQILSEAVRPPLLRMSAARSPYTRPLEPHDTFTHAPVGWIWQHHATLDSRLHKFKELGQMVTTSCDANTLIFSDESEQIFSRLYAGGTPVTASVDRINGFDAFRATVGGRHFIFIIKMNAWPNDAVAMVLNDPSFDKYQLYADPYLPSIYDKAAIPPNRLAKFGCNGS